MRSKRSNVELGKGNALHSAVEAGNFTAIGHFAAVFGALLRIGLRILASNVRRRMQFQTVRRRKFTARTSTVGDSAVRNALRLAAEELDYRLLAAVAIVTSPS